MRVSSCSAEGGGTGRGAKRRGRTETGPAQPADSGRAGGDELDRREGGDKARAEGAPPRVRVAALVNVPGRAGAGPRGEIRVACSARPAQLAPAIRPSDSAPPPHRGGMRPGSYCAAHRGELGRIAAGDPEAYPGFRDDLDAQQNYIQKAPPRARRGVFVRACVRACVRA